jgi:Tol biopolymer transport system component
LAVSQISKTAAVSRAILGSRPRPEAIMPSFPRAARAALGALLALPAAGGEARNVTNVMDLADGRLSRITDSFPVYDSWLGFHPTDSTFVVCSRKDGDAELYVIDASGREHARLTDNGFRDCDPDWSPDGRWIAFHSDRSGDYEIWVMRADGSDPRPITASPGSDLGPVWIR